MPIKNLSQFTTIGDLEGKRKLTLDHGRWAYGRCEQRPDSDIGSLVTFDDLSGLLAFVGLERS